MQVNKRIVITTAILGCSTLIILGVLTVPTIIAISDFRQKIIDAKLKIETRYALRNQDRDATNKLEEARQRLLKLTQIGIREGSELAFVNALENAASTSGVTQELNMEMTGQRQISPYESEIPMKIHVIGDYRDALIYMHRVENLSYYIHINSIDVRASQTAGNNSGAVDVQINGIIHWFAKSLPIFQALDLESKIPTVNL